MSAWAEMKRKAVLVAIVAAATPLLLASWAVGAVNDWLAKKGEK